MTGLVRGMLAVALLATVSPAHASEPPAIAILDTGIVAWQPAFAPGQVKAWRDFVSGFPEPYDDHGHGTSVASRAAGLTVGAASPGADLIVAKVLRSDNGLSSWSLVQQAIVWAVDEGADVINVSIWGSVPNPTGSFNVAGAINYARERGVLVVWIAGNGGQLQQAPAPNPVPATTLPGASSPQALIVGAAAPNGMPAGFSQRDPELLAYGQDVLIALPGGGHGRGWGTSFAAPWIAGAAARLITEGAPRDPDWLEWIMLHAAADRSEWTYLDEGYGLFDDDALARAIAIVRGEQPIPGLDERDLWHVATTVPRVAQTTRAPGGILPPP